MGDPAPQTSPDLGQIHLSSKTSGAYIDVTHKLIMQRSRDVEALVRRELATSMALCIDSTGYYGSGTDKQPLGLANTKGISVKELAGAFPTYGELVELESEISEKNADVGTMRFKARPNFRSNAKQTLKSAVNGAGTIWEPGDTVNGYACDITNQVRTGDMFFGNFANVIMGLWGGLVINVDPYSKSRSGSIRVVTFQDIDWPIRCPESFLIIKSKASNDSKPQKQAS